MNPVRILDCLVLFAASTFVLFASILAAIMIAHRRELDWKYAFFGIRATQEKEEENNMDELKDKEQRRRNGLTDIGRRWEDLHAKYAAQAQEQFYKEYPGERPDTQESPVPRYPCDACREADCGVRKPCECKNPVCPCSTPVPREETVCGEGWLIERGQLCLGQSCGKPAWVTFTDPNAIRFARELDAKNMLTSLQSFGMESNAFHDCTVSGHEWVPPARVPDTPGAIPSTTAEAFQSGLKRAIEIVEDYRDRCDENEHGEEMGATMILRELRAALATQGKQGI